MEPDRAVWEYRAPEELKALLRLELGPDGAGVDGMGRNGTCQRAAEDRFHVQLSSRSRPAPAAGALRVRAAGVVTTVQKMLQYR